MRAAAGSSAPASLAIINALLDGKNISEDYRGLAVVAAARNNSPASPAIIKALLDGKNISEDHRGEALIEAVKKGSAEIVGLLLPHGPIEMPKLQEAMALAQELHEDSIITLLQPKLSG